MKNFNEYCRFTLSQSISTLSFSDKKAVISYYGDKNECDIHSYFSPQIQNGKLYDSVNEFSETTLIGEVDELENIFEQIRLGLFNDWFCETIDDIDEDDIIDVSSEVTKTNHTDFDDDGNEFIHYTDITYNNKSSFITDNDTITEGDMLFDSLFFTHMNEHNNQNVRKAAILAGAKYVYVSDDNSEVLYFK
jgi:hypothetical protein